jgi:hypothetical protein
VSAWQTLTAGWSTGQYFVLPVCALLAVVCLVLWVRDVRSHEHQEADCPVYPISGVRVVQTTTTRFYDQDREGWWI